jgi:hypothetical protein
MTSESMSSAWLTAGKFTSDAQGERQRVLPGGEVARVDSFGVSTADLHRGGRGDPAYFLWLKTLLGSLAPRTTVPLARRCIRQQWLKTNQTQKPQP